MGSAGEWTVHMQVEGLQNDNNRQVECHTGSLKQMFLVKTMLKANKN